MTDKSVIHKQVFDLGAAPDDLIQTFGVPRTAELLSIDWDTRNRLGIALWYRFRLPHANYTGPNYTVPWRITVRGTGDPFPGTAKFLGTVVRDGFAWHLLDIGEEPVRWVDR